MNKTHSLSIVFAILIVTSSARSAFSAPATPQPGVQVNAAGAKVEPQPVAPVAAYKKYAYFGDRHRDPFIPLTGEYRTDQSAMDRPPQIVSLILKGIVQDAKGRMALLTSGANSYILRGGRLYDGRNRMVKKIAGVIKTESVVMIGADRTVREIKSKSAF